MKCFIASLIAFSLIFVAYALYQNYKGSYCAGIEDCANTLVIKLSYWNTEEGSVITQQALSLLIVIIFVIMMQIIRYSIRKIIIECDVLDISITDFSLVVQNIPKELGIDYSKELKSLFENSFENNKIVVEEINLVYDISDLKKYSFLDYFYAFQR